MIRTLTRAAGLSSLLVIASCASQKVAPETGFPVEGSAGDLRRLQGRWEGDYKSAATGRSGTIVFEFRSGEIAYGDVLMMPKGASAPLAPARPDGGPAATASMPQVLTIRFVQAEGGALTGDLAPYQDPDCSCEVETSFSGRFDKSDNAIRGTFTSTQRRPEGRRVTGEWNVTRSARKPEKVS